MVISSAGTVVLVQFQFSDLSKSKLRPAVVPADAGRGDGILCQITSQQYSDPAAIEITTSDITGGSFRRDSYARPAKIFTANSGIITKKIGELNSAKRDQILRAIIELLEQGLS